MRKSISREAFHTEAYEHIDRFFDGHAEFVRDAAAKGQPGKKLSGSIMHAGALLSQSPLDFLSDQAAMTMAEYALSVVGHMLTSGKWTEADICDLLKESVDRAANSPHEIGSSEWTAFIAGEPFIDPTNN